MTNPDTLWAREGDFAKQRWVAGAWGPFVSYRSPEERSESRRSFHGFDFRVESVNGQKTLVKEEAQ